MTYHNIWTQPLKAFYRQISALAAQAEREGAAEGTPEAAQVASAWAKTRALVAAELARRGEAP